LEKNHTLILGIGNLLMGDEGVGIHVANFLSSQKLPDNVVVLDGGTGGFTLLGELQSYDRCIIVDASLDKYPEGHIRVLTPKYSSDFPPSLSAHDIGLKELIEALILLDKRPEITLVAISIKDLDRFIPELTPKIDEAAGIAAQIVIDLL